MLFREILNSIIKGFVLSILYFETTQMNDTTPKNIFLFISFYVIISNSATLVEIDPNVVTTAFVTKTIFTLIDERIRKKDEKN
jgi:hypothetical protein